MTTIRTTLHCFLATIAAAGFLMLQSPAANAEGVKILTEDDVLGAVRKGVAQNLPTLFNSELQGNWNAMRPGIEKKMRDELGRGDRFAKGVTFYNITCNLARNVSDVHFYPSNGFIQMRFRLKGNYLKATSTTPGPLGKYADPTFEVRFDALFIVDITYPGRDLQFKAGQARVSIHNVRFDSQGIVADVLKLVNNIANFFTKTADGKKVLISAIEAKTYTYTVSLNKVLARVNQTLAKLAAQKYAKKSVYFDKAAKAVIVTMHRKSDLSLQKIKSQKASPFVLKSSILKSTRPKSLTPIKALGKIGSNSSLNPQPLPPKTVIPKPLGKLPM